jgi:hypothetical protein
MKTQYIFRLDDASEFMDLHKWNPFFELFDKYDIKPIIAVIPFNRDPKMIIGKPDLMFWDKVRQWQKKGYHIAMHGYEHLYSNNERGLIGLNNYSEFAGVPFEKQCEMLSNAFCKFQVENIKTKIFVAPAHSFDKNTLKALRKVTTITQISDGFFLNPIKMHGLNWIPQQLWVPKNKKNGLWTICYHPETSNNSILNMLELFLENNSTRVVDPLSLTYGAMKIEDFMFSFFMRTKIILQRLLK